MKKIFSLALMFICYTVIGQTPVTSSINKVKVFKRKAEIQRLAQTTISPGRQEVVLTGISTNINPSSLQIKFKNSAAELLTAKYERNYLIPKINNPKTDALQASSEQITDELSWVSEQKNALLGVENILKKHQELGKGNVGFTPAQVLELSNNFKKKYLEVKKELSALKKEEKALNLKLSRITNQLKEMSAQTNKPSGTIILQVIAKTSERLKIECSYTVNNAGWTPIYDLRSAGITEKVKLNYRANIFQNTGQDWKNVNLIVSTGNPSQNNERPVLHPQYLNFTAPYIGLTNNYANISGLNSAQPTNVRDDYLGDNELNVEFKVVRKQSIISDGKQNLMALNTYELPTDYIYHTVPKISTGAFLIAKVTDWSQYNLQAGKANIFFEGAFVGTSSINPNITSDTMLLSMGRDNNIVVKRNKLEKYNKKKSLESKRKETIGYEVIVKNKKSVPINIEVLDQIPITRQSSKSTVSLLNKGAASYTKEIGKLLWTKKIEASKSWKGEFAYTVKHPKKDAVASLK